MIRFSDIPGLLADAVLVFAIFAILFIIGSAVNIYVVEPWRMRQATPLEDYEGYEDDGDTH